METKTSCVDVGVTCLFLECLHEIVGCFTLSLFAVEVNGFSFLLLIGEGKVPGLELCDVGAVLLVAVFSHGDVMLVMEPLKECSPLSRYSGFQLVLLIPLPGWR